MRKKEGGRCQTRCPKMARLLIGSLSFYPILGVLNHHLFFYCSAAVASFVIVCPDGFIVITKKGSNASDWEVIIPGKMHRATRP